MFILASQSEIRAQILANAGLEFEAMQARVDEESVKAAFLAEGYSARDLADALAELKSQKISRKMAGVLVLGCDQTLECEGVLISKSQTPEEMRIVLQNLRGQKHKLYSAAVISLDGQPIWRFIGEAQISMRDFSDAFLDAYIYENFETIQYSVGGYQIEGIGAKLIDDYRGDYFSFLGWPLLAILRFLRQRGEIQN